MLIGFLIKDYEDWKSWRRGVRNVKGKPIVNVADMEPVQLNNRERRSAVDDVETFDEEDESDGELVECPPK